MQGLLSRVKGLRQKEEEEERKRKEEEEKRFKPPPPFSKEELDYVHQWFHEPIPAPISKAGIMAFNSEIPRSAKTPTRKRRDKNVDNYKAVATSQYTVVSNFKTSTADPDAQAAYVSLVESIIVRENNLLNVANLSKFTDDLYWKYSLLRIRDRKKQRNKKELSLMKKKIFLKQEEIVIAVAHLRSSSIEVVRNLVMYRRFLNKVNDVDASVSVMWQGENYLIKMIDDSRLAFGDTLVCRLWLGFEPNTFMVPPAVYDVRGTNGRRESMYQNWLTEHIRSRRATKQSIAPLQQLPGPTSFSVHSNEENEEEAQIKKNDGVDAERENENKAEEGKEGGTEGIEESMKEGKSQSLPQVKPYIDEVCQGTDAVEIAQFKAYFFRSCRDWERDFTSISDDPSAVPSFWTEYEHDRSVARAVAGYPELVPQVDLIPELPPLLMANCKALNNVILAELDIQKALDSMRAQTEVLRRSKKELFAPTELRDISLGRRMESSLQQSLLLRERQQTHGGQFATAFNLGTLRELEQMSPEASSFFLTSNLLGGERQLLQDIWSMGDPNGSLTPLRLNRRRVEREVADRVEAGRVMVGRNRDGTLQVIESKRRCNRDLPPRMEPDEAIALIQTVARTYLSMQRFKRRARERRVLDATHAIQRVVRGFLGRQCYKSAQKLFKLQFRVVRKYVLRKQKAAEKITKLIRRAAYIGSKTRSIVRRENMIERSQRYDYYSAFAMRFDASCTVIQKIWRGILGRKNMQKFLRMRRRQKAKDEQMEAKLAMVGRSTGVLVGGDGEGNNLTFKLTRANTDDANRISLDSPGGSSPDGGNSPMESRVQTPKATLDYLEIDPEFGTTGFSQRATLTRTVSSDVLKTGVRHSLLLPVDGNTKGKLLSGKKLAMLVDPPTGGKKALKDKEANNAVTWRDFYRPPVFYGATSSGSGREGPRTARSASAPSLDVEGLELNQSVESLPANFGSNKPKGPRTTDPESLTRFLRSSLNF